MRCGDLEWKPIKTPLGVYPFKEGDADNTYDPDEIYIQEH